MPTRAHAHPRMHACSAPVLPVPQTVIIWPYKYVRAAFRNEPGIGSDLSFLLRAAGQSLRCRGAPSNASMLSLLQRVAAVMRWHRALAARAKAKLRAGRRKHST